MLISLPRIRRTAFRWVLAPVALAAAVAVGLLASSCGGDGDSLTIYAGRSQTLVQPLLERFADESGRHVRVRYGDSTELALAILEEGGNSPADVYYGQDIGAFAALADRLQPPSDSVLEQVPERFRSPDGTWVGISGRARVVAYNTDKLQPEDLPDSILDYTDPAWRGRLGIVPRSDGFPEFVTALRATRGEEFARQWLKDLNANNPVKYPNNLAAIQAVANGEIDVAFVNHYYLYRFLQEEGADFGARNYYFENGDIGGLFMVVAAGVLDTAGDQEAAEEFVNFLLSSEAQEYFANKTYEYPLAAGVEPNGDLPPLTQLQTPNVDVTDMTDLRGSLELMQQTGILP